MNKIFRIVWSQATQSWVVVSELTKAHKKQSSSNSQGSAVKFSGNFIKSSAIALALLSGHSAYAAVNAQGTGSGDSVAWGTSSNASGNNAVAVGKESTATQNNAVAVGRKAQATGDSAIAVGIDSQASGTLAEAIGVGAKATGDKSVAIGNVAKASNESSVALGTSAESTNKYTTAVGGTAFATQEGATALGYGARATAKDTIAIGKSAKAEQEGVIALGLASFAQGKDTIAIGNSAAAKKEGDIILGKDAKSRDQGIGRSIAIGQRATAGSNRSNFETNDQSTGLRADDGSVAIGTNAYTGLNKNNTAVNNSVALGAGAGVGYRSVDTDGKPLGVGTDADDNDKVLVKAFGGTTSTLNYFQNSGKAKDDNFFSFQNVDINEGTALGRNTRAIGDQSVAIGAQSVAGQGSIVIGGNDIQAYDGKKYFKAANPNSGDAKGVNDFNAETTPGTGKNGQPITITAKYKELVGTELDRAYRASYGQDGSTVIGMQAHSTTPLGVAIGTNSIVRKGAFGATAIGSGASVVANAEAAVAIGMGAEAQGSYAVAAGTAARAKESAVAAGYQANADKSAVAVGDSSKATNSSVAVGQLAQATKEADIAVGQGAKASGNQGAIAMGLGTNAQGDSSIMIGGSDISSAAGQKTEFEKATGGITAKSVTEKINGKDVTRNYTFAATTKTPGTIAEAYKELTGLDMDVSTLDFAHKDNKNGHASTSLGVHALATGNLATAIGASARANAIGSLALGTGAHATKQNAVAIGTGSTTDLVGTRQLSVNYDSDGNIVSDTETDKIAYTFKWAGGTHTSEGDVVSFGSSGAERQLKNVAAGRVAEDSTDAINGSQLNSITKKIAAGFNTSGNEVAGSSGVFTSKKANADSAKKDYETAIRSDDKVQLQVGNNLKLDRDETVSEVDVQDDFDKTKTVKKKIRKADFAYSLNPVLTNLTSAEFKGTDANAPTTKLTNEGVTITPVGKSPVSLTQNGLDNGGNPITNVAGNLDGSKANTTAPTTKADKPSNVDGIKNNAATVGDVLNAGWNLQEKGTAKDFVTAYDTVNFVDGDGTSVSVENTAGKTSTIKYSVNTGNGLQKDPTGNTISVKPADKSLEVTNEGVKVKAADNTLTTDDNGLKVNTGTINPVNSGDKAGTVAVNPNDTGKIATVDTVVNAVNNAAWNAIASKTNDGENGGTVKKQAVKAGDTVTFEADKNIKIAQTDGKFTFSTKDNVEFTTVKVGNTANGKKPVELKSGDVITANNNPEQPTTALNVSSDSKPTQITGVGSVLNTTPVTTTPDGSAPTTQPNVVNLGTAHGQTPLSPNVLNSAATVRDLANMGWKVSSDKATGAEDKSYNDVVRNADEVKFVGKNAAKVSGKTVNGVRTITVDVEVPSVETAKITQNTDGSVTGPAGETLTKALKDAKDELAKLPKDADPAKVQAAKDKVDAAQKAIDDSPNSNKVATAQNVADMINNSGFTLKTSKVEGGEKDATSTGDEVINPGKAVEMIAGKNLTVKQEANGKVTYSTKDNVEFTSVKVGDTQNGKAPVNFTTEAAKPASNNGMDKTPTTALNVSSDGKPTQITGVGSTLNVKPVDTNTNGTPTADADKPNLVDLVGPKDAPVNKNAAATVGDLQNMGWLVSTKDGNGYNDVVKNANQVDFVGKNGITVTGETKDGIRTITVEAAQTPVVYTNKAGDKLVKVGDKFYKAGDVVNGKPTGTEVPKEDVIASMNNGDNTANNPMHLSNIGSNLPTVNDTNKQAFDPNSTTPKAGKDNKSAPITAKEAADIVNNAGNNAATVSDVLNAGWNLQNNGEARDFVKPYDTVNFINGKGTVAVVETADDATSSTVKFDVDAGEITSNTNGSVNGPTTAENAKKLADDLKKAEQAVKDLPADAPEDKKAEAQKALKDAQAAAAPLNKVATAQNVADMINNSGFTLKAGKTEGDNLTAADLANGEMINPGDTITMKAGKNMSVKHEKDGSITYATKDDVSFNTVNVGDNTYVDENGKPVTKNTDGTYTDSKGQPIEEGKVTKLAPVAMKAEKAKPATNNGNKAEDQPTTALNVSSSDGKPTQITGVGSTLNVKPVDTNPNGTPTTGDARPNLVDLVGTKDAPVNKNAAATVGDLQNMGWVVSTKDGNGYKDVVKNANQVDFKGTGLATVTGETDKDGIRTITVNVDAQKTVEAAQTPVVYTNKAGDKLVKVGDKFYKAGDVVNGKPKENAQEVPKGDVIASMNNGDNKTNKPMQLANIGSNLPTVNDTNKQAFDPNSTTPKAGKDNKSAPITAKEAADIVNNAGNNAATVSDVLNAGWNLQNNGEARDFVKPYDTVNFINGKGTVAVVETADDATSSTVKFDVDAGEITSNTNGSVNGPTTAENAKKLADDLKKAEQAVKDLPADAPEDKKAEAQKALKDAQAAAAPLNKVATAQNVADMINNSGFTLKAGKTEGDNLTAADLANGEMINPGDTITMKAGKNMSVKHEKDGSITYATKDDVSFNTVNVGDNTYVDENGKPVTKNTDGTYTDSKGQPIEEGKVTKLAPVAMKAEKAKPATNNGNKAEDQPTTALNVSSSDGKPTQITGVGSTLNVKPVDTNPNGTPTTGDARPNLVDLVGTKDAPVNKNAAATVGDLQNMGWVVSTKDGNGYKDVVKNANQVDFKGGAGISVKGTTTTDGVREITISVKDGEVIKPNQFTAKVNGTDTPVTKVGDQYYNTADIDPKTGKPNAKANPVTPDAGTTPTNAGDGYVTGNKVATAIQKSGFVVGKQTEKLSAADFNDKDEKVNPDDELRFADGNNTKVKLATKESVDKDGNKVTTTTVKVDVTGLPVQYTDKNGTPVTKVGDKYFTVDDKGNPTVTEVKPADLTTNMVNPAAAPNVIGAPTALGNVKSNLPSVNDADKNAKDVAGNPIAGKDNKSAPITATEAADLLNPKTADGKANPKFAGNNAATVSDVLNTGWNLQNNGEAKDFVKPYDTVNFVDGKGTKAVVETTPNGTTSNVKFDIDTGSITNNADGSVQGPVVTPEMTKALEDATNALNSLPPTAPAAVIDAAKKAVADAANNIANVANKVATAQDVANAINKSGFTLSTSANGGEKISGTPEMINPGKKVEMVAGKNMTVKQESNGKVTYATASNVTFDSVQFGDKGPKITNKAGNINVSSPDGKTPTKVTGVAPGEISATSKDAINGSQLYAVAAGIGHKLGDLDNKINKVGKRGDAGTASALAAANIPQAYTPGKSLVGIAAGSYQGQNGLAVGMSRISDNGKIIIRLSGTANSQGKTGVAAGVGYQW